MLVCLPFLACTQSPVTANETMPTFEGGFDYGCNMGYYPPYFYDKQLAELVHGESDEQPTGYGVTSIRPGLFEHFLDFWGYEVRKAHFSYYDSIGLRNIVAISGFPGERNRDSAFYCQGRQSNMFKNMYKPIWDDGANGTPVNEENPYAVYIWKAANTYKGLVKIWEVWNEPDAGNGNGSLLPGQPGNWWENAPQPCEIAIQAPPFFYIRALRITYEIVKHVDPQAFVAVGGLGWPSFLDVICRYSDNPFGGETDPLHYPLTGGAYFDCMSFHAYPHFNGSLRSWNNELQAFEYKRHSDAAVDGLWQLRDSFKLVLEKYGYDGSHYPEKLWICSEFNIPRKQFKDYIGSDLAQVNFITKSLVTAQMQDVAQMHIYSIADEKPGQSADPEFAWMGLFKNLEGKSKETAQPNDVAYALKTTQELLDDMRYDPVQTQKMNLPEEVGGGAFSNGAGEFVYVLWAKTNIDQSETASAIYQFPQMLNLRYLDTKPWHHSYSGAHYLVNARQVFLTASPVFLTETQITNDFPKQLKLSPNPSADGISVAEFWIFSEAASSLEILDVSGKRIALLVDQERLVEGPHARLINISDWPAGIYFVRLSTPESNLTQRLVKTGKR
ncbi:MAG: T9SS type A sorting domain-containing protein [Saprospiraceae bacterium]|nr:T9SS type A sorting domain-containing protein [Saprospiraceae bacterium]